VRWYLRDAFSSRDWEEMMAEGGLWVDHTTLSRWVQHSAAECEKRSRPHLKACNDSWRVDETSIKVKKTWMSLSRAVASEANTLAFLLSATREAEAAKRFFVTALGRRAGSATQASGSEQPGDQARRTDAPQAAKSAPRVSNVEKNAASPKAMADLTASGILPANADLRQVKYLNTIVQQDHRFIKGLVKPAMGFFSMCFWQR
jgi:IS6 family transposase